MTLLALTAVPPAAATAPALTASRCATPARCCQRCKTFHSAALGSPGPRRADMMDDLFLHPGLWRGDIFGCGERHDSSVLSDIALTSAIWLLLNRMGWVFGLSSSPVLIVVADHRDGRSPLLWFPSIFWVQALNACTWESFDLGRSA